MKNKNGHHKITNNLRERCKECGAYHTKVKTEERKKKLISDESGGIVKTVQSPKNRY